MLKEFGDFGTNEEARPPEEVALQRAVTKQITTKKEEEDVINKRNKYPEDELDTLLDKDAIQAGEIALAKQETNESSFTRNLEAKLEKMEESLKKKIRSYGAKSFHKDDLDRKVDDNTDELNEIYNTLHEVLMTTPPTEPRSRKRFFREQKEMTIAVRKTRERLESEILRAKAYLEILKDKQTVTATEAAEAYEALKNIQSILRPNKNLGNN
ncbi:MAG: superfamily II RNA helicase [Candidatus Paceibacteria bacterium]|jgi:superfamily II RNA helicase